MAAPDVCPACGGQGWVPYVAEAANGEIESAYRLCGCRTKGAAVPFPSMCRRPGCRTTIPKGETWCGPHLAEWDANADAEAWEHAAGAYRPSG